MHDVIVAEQIELACLIEATARKPGNVHPAASFDDLSYEDFSHAARMISKPLASATETGIGRAIFEAVQATQNSLGTNVNLGIVLLLAPLAAVKQDIPLEPGINRVLEQTTIEDAEHVYAAIRLAQPGGMGRVASQDIWTRPTVNLREAMALAADHDRIAEQYVNGFQHVFEARKQLCNLMAETGNWEAAIISLHLWMLSKWHDTLIARKCGRETAEQALLKASDLWNRAAKTGAIALRQLDEFDAWLRADGHRRNPGTTADLIAACVFAALRDHFIAAPTLQEIHDRAALIRRECREQ